MACYKYSNFMNYINKFINLISFFLSSIVFIIIYFLFFNQTITIEKIYSLIPEISIIKDNIKEISKENNIEEQKIDLGDWYIEIPTINLKAPIAEGTDQNILNTKVGHFTDTALDFGNVGLAAHNRGYEYNYFENLKKLKNDDKIIYNYKNITKTYIVNKIEIIENSNWEFLKKTEDNRITLITCVENEPQYRRCVQAVEV